MGNWTTSKYRERKAKRQAERPAQWFTNPETNEQFFIRPVGGAVSLLAQSLPTALKEEALEGWREHGIEVDSDVEQQVEQPVISKRTAEEADRINQMSAKLIYETCLIPTLTAIGEDVKSIQERALRNCELAFVDDASWKTASDEQKLERAAEVVLPLGELEESDAKFILRQAYSYIGEVPMKGGQAANVAQIKSLPKKPGVRSRTGTSG